MDQGTPTYNNELLAGPAIQYAQQTSDGVWGFFRIDVIPLRPLDDQLAYFAVVT